MRMKDPVPTFSYVVKELAKRHTDLAYLHVVEPVVSGDNDAQHAQVTGSGQVISALTIRISVKLTQELEASLE